jgi:hypothetical protein
MQNFFSLAILALFALPLPQEGRQEPAPPAEEKRGRAEIEAERIRNELCGAWQLVRAEIAAESFAGAQCLGYLIVQPEYCSLQARLTSPQPGGQVSLAGMTAGTYRWSYEEGRLALSLSTLLAGSDLENPDGQIDYEPPGTRRDYEVVIARDDLTLTRGGGRTRMFFRRLPPPKPVRKPEQK